jgi:hypothetical protein
MATRKLSKKPKEVTEIQIIRPPRAKLSKEEVLKRMEEFPMRKEQFIATVQKGKN